MSKTYTVLNGAVAGAAAPVAVTTGTAIKTHIQLATGATVASIRIIEWWVEFNGSAAATPIAVELIRHTGGPVTTLTAYVAADVAKQNDPNANVSTIQLGAALSGYTATAEVTPTTVSTLATHFVPPTSGIYIQYPLGREPEIAVATFARLRTTAPAAVNMYAGISWEE